MWRASRTMSVAVCCSVLQCDMTYSYIISICNAPVVQRELQFVAVCCSVLQCVAVCCSVLQWGRTHLYPWPDFSIVCCGVLQCVAVCCSVLQCDMTPSYVWHDVFIHYLSIWHAWCVAVCYSVLQCDMTPSRVWHKICIHHFLMYRACCTMRVAACCSVLQCVKLCCTVLHCVALWAQTPTQARQWVISHIWMSHINESRHTYEWGMPHI